MVKGQRGGKCGLRKGSKEASCKKEFEEVSQTIEGLKVSNLGLILCR